MLTKRQYPDGTHGEHSEESECEDQLVVLSPYPRIPRGRLLLGWGIERNRSRDARNVVELEVGFRHMANLTHWLTRGML